MGQRTFEETLDVVKRPLEGDVLCGKDKMCLQAPGSKAFRDVIETFVRRYQQADSKMSKMTITKEIEAKFAQTSSRFLKYDANTGFWEQLSSPAIRDKIGHALRFANRRKRSKRSKQRCSPKHQRTNSELRSSSSSGCESSDASSVASHDATDSFSETSSLPASRNVLKYDEEQTHDEFRPVTKIIQRLNLIPGCPPLIPVSPDRNQATQPKAVKKLSQGDVYSIMNAPMIELEPQTVHRIHEV